MAASEFQPDISVVMGVRDMEDTIGAQLTALARQDFAGSWEVVIADNGSRDRSGAIADQWRDRLPLRLVDASGPGESGFAKNVGAAAASGELLAFCDADDEVRPDWLRAMAGALQSSPLVAGTFDYGRLNPPEIAAMYDEPLGAPRWGFLPAGTGANLGIRRSVFDQVGGFRVGYPNGDDTALCWRAQLAGYELSFVPSAVVDRRLKVRSPRSMYLLSVRDGRSVVRHFKEFRVYGMRRTPLRDLVYDCITLPIYLARGKRLQAARVAGFRTGHAVASLRLRTFCP